MNSHPSRVRKLFGLSRTDLTTLLLLWTVGGSLGGVTDVQATSPITSSGLNTQVNLAPIQPPGKVQYDITGGTRPGGGLNLYHSFGNFNVPMNSIANFLNDFGLATSNILARGTRGIPASVFGTIQTNGAGEVGHATRLLMNPAGVIFSSRIGLSEMQACYLHVGGKFDSSFSTLTPGKEPHLNATIHGRPPDGAAATLGG